MLARNESGCQKGQSRTKAFARLNRRPPTGVKVSRTAQQRPVATHGARRPDTTKPAFLNILGLEGIIVHHVQRKYDFDGKR